jgi:hypothetical protein
MVSGVTISNGYATNVGGGLLFVPSLWTGTVQNCVISDNVAASSDGAVWAAGGGLYGSTVSGWGVVISNCVVRRNVATNTATTTASMGGGLHVVGFGYKWITGCRIEDNSAGSRGGGVSASYGATLVENSVIRGNGTQAQTGDSTMGGGGLHGGGVTFRNCLICNNVAFNFGGGVCSAQNGPLTFHNCTIVSNSASVAGGIRTRRAGDVVTMVNSIVCSNSPVDILSLATSTNFYTNCCLGSTNGLGVVDGARNITNSPCFAGFARQDFRLARTSPCINTGTNQPWMGGARDLDGWTRLDPESGTVDMGCYEYPWANGSGTVFTSR